MNIYDYSITLNNDFHYLLHELVDTLNPVNQSNIIYDLENILRLKTFISKNIFKKISSSRLDYFNRTIEKHIMPRHLDGSWADYYMTNTKHKSKKAFDNNAGICHEVLMQMQQSINSNETYVSKTPTLIEMLDCPKIDYTDEKMKANKFYNILDNFISVYFPEYLDLYKSMQDSNEIKITGGRLDLFSEKIYENDKNHVVVKTKKFDNTTLSYLVSGVASICQLSSIKKGDYNRKVFCNDSLLMYVFSVIFNLQFIDYVKNDLKRPYDAQILCKNFIWENYVYLKRSLREFNKYNCFASSDVQYNISSIIGTEMFNMFGSDPTLLKQKMDIIKENIGVIDDRQIFNKIGLSEKDIIQGNSFHKLVKKQII